MSRPIHGSAEADSNRAHVINAITTKLAAHGFSFQFDDNIHHEPIAAESALEWGFDKMQRATQLLLAQHEALFGYRYNMMTEGGSTDPDGQPVPQFGRLGPGVTIRDGVVRWKNRPSD